MTKPLRTRPVKVVTGRQPFEVAILVASACCGLALALTDTSPKSAATAMPGLIQVLWQVFLIVGGIVGLIGIFFPGRLIAQLGTEAVGVMLVGTATTMYSIALFTVSGLQALAAGAFVTAVAVAGWWRIGQIWHDLRRVFLAEQEGQVSPIPLLTEERR